jgi:esterase/lipase
MTKKKSLLLFLHGALGTSEEMTPLMEIMKEKGFQVQSLTFSGHGISSIWPSEFRIDLFSQDLEHFLKENKIDKVSVFGYSMGGYVALYHKLNFPDSPIDRIFTYGTKFNWSSAAVAKELPMLDPEYIQNKFPPYAESLKSKHGERWKSLLRSTAHLIQNLEKLDGLTREDLAEIDIPVTLILGDQDRMVTTEETQLTREWIPHSRMKTVAHSKHEMDKTNLKEIAQILVEEME